MRSTSNGTAASTQQAQRLAGAEFEAFRSNLLALSTSPIEPFSRCGPPLARAIASMNGISVEGLVETLDAVMTQACVQGPGNRREYIPALVKEAASGLRRGEVFATAVEVSWLEKQPPLATRAAREPAMPSPPHFATLDRLSNFAAEHAKDLLDHSLWRDANKLLDRLIELRPSVLNRDSEVFESALAKICRLVIDDACASAKPLLPVGERELVLKAVRVVQEGLLKMQQMRSYDDAIYNLRYSLKHGGADAAPYVEQLIKASVQFRSVLAFRPGRKKREEY